MGTGAAPGQPWEQQEEEEEGVCWPEILAKRVYLLLTTGTAELHNCSLPRVQGPLHSRARKAAVIIFAHAEPDFPLAL